MNLAELKPLKDQVLVEPIRMPEKVGSIYLTDQTRSRNTQQATVISVGAQNKLPVKVGDRLHIRASGGTEFCVEGKQYLLIREAEMLAVYE